MSRRPVATEETVRAAVSAIRSRGQVVRHRGGLTVDGLTLIHQEVGGDYYRVRALTLFALELEGQAIPARWLAQARRELAAAGRRVLPSVYRPTTSAPTSKVAPSSAQRQELPRQSATLPGPAVAANVDLAALTKALQVRQRL